jgi:FRG domain
MRALSNNKMWCHLSIESGKRHTNREIRQSRPMKVSNFRELVPVVAQIANHNPDYSLFYRGQPKDYKLTSGASSFYPTIFRSPGRALTNRDLTTRFKRLHDCAKHLVRGLESKNVPDIDRLKKFQELRWSILQHYNVCDTPLIDLTHSLRVAAFFALNQARFEAYIYVFALPHPLGTITYSTEDELLNVRLLSASPSTALRPHFQEGYLVGTFPSEPERKHPSLDLGVRLIAKLEIPKNKFWSDSFHAIPDEALYPDNDLINMVCKDIEPGSS